MEPSSGAVMSMVDMLPASLGGHWPIIAVVMVVFCAFLAFVTTPHAAAVAPTAPLSVSFSVPSALVTFMPEDSVEKGDLINDWKYQFQSGGSQHRSFVLTDKSGKRVFISCALNKASKNKDAVSNCQVKIK